MRAAADGGAQHACSPSRKHMCLFVVCAEVAPGARVRAPEAARRAGATQAVPVHAADALCSDVGECLVILYAVRRGGAVQVFWVSLAPSGP